MKHYVAIAIALIITSCTTNKEPEIIDYVAKNDQEITDYLTKNNLAAIKTSTGLYYIINEEGTGDQPTANSDVTVVYTGRFINGQVFNQSKETGLTFNLQKVIKGWTEGIPYFKVGGSGLLLVPSHLGYGSYDYYTIPGGSVLIFEINLVDVE